MPDVDNMVILVEIFKTTLDKLLRDTAASTEQKPSVYTSETVYDIDCEKHFDINIGTASSITLSSGADEKLHVTLSSETIEDLDMFKVRLDDTKNILDINCLNKNKMSRYEAEDSLSVTIVLPGKYADSCEIEASVKLLEIKDFHSRCLEYDGDAERIIISNSSGSLEFTSKTDHDITVDKITGRLDINQ